MMKRLALILIFFVGLAAPAHAAFIGAAISALSAAYGALSVAGQALVLTIGRLVLSAAVTAYQKRRMKKKLASRQPGITTQFVGTGGTTALTVIVGRYATNGHLEAPQMSHPDGSSPPNAYLTYVIGLGDVPITGLTGRVIINDQWAALSSAPATSLPEFGVTVEGQYANRCWFRFHDGSQTEADPWMLSTFGSYPERPWLADMVGRGIPHVIATFERVPELFPGEPRLRFEALGIKLYDPRKDSSVGGTGLHRWADPATWEFSENPKVIEYNIRRGLRIEGFGVWGGNAEAGDLPLDNWFAAMNACDVQVDNGEGGTEPAYVFGFEFSTEDEPRQIIDEINRSCGGETVEVGGVYKTRVGGVGLPVYFMTDGDILVSRPRELEPFLGLEDTFNAISCSFPDPSILWEPREGAPLTNAALELEDGSIEWDWQSAGFVRRPRRLLKQVSLPAVSNPRQVQRLISAMVAEGRKQIRHVLSLPPSALLLEPLDAVSWTSDRNGYSAKLFEVVLTADPVFELRPRIGLLEADPSDYATPNYLPLPEVSVRNPPFSPIEVEGFGIAPYSVADANGQPRYPAVRLFWDGAAMAPVSAIAYELKVAATDQLVRQGSTARAGDGQVILDGLLPNTAYRGRVRPVTDRPTDWSAWLDVQTPDLRLTPDDLSDAVQDALDQATNASAEARAMVDEALVEVGVMVQQVRDETKANFAVEAPRLAAAEDALDSIASQVSWLTSRNIQISERLAQAGLYIDPANGKARLEAVTLMNERYTEVSVRLDAVAGDLALKVSRAEVDEAIAEAVLDPSQIPAFSGINTRLTDLEIGLSAAEGAITQRATVVDLAAVQTSVSQATSRLDAAEAAINQRVLTATFGALEARVTTAEFTLSGFDGAGMALELADIRARTDDLADVNLAALADTWRQQQRRQADTAVLRQEYHALVDNERVARASLRTELGAAIDQNAAQIVAEQVARADQDSALATQIAGLNATTAANVAAITSEAAARADADFALAGQISTVQATASAKNRTFVQTSAPSAPTLGDLWFNPSEGNALRRFDGAAWAGVDNATLAANAAAISTETAARATADDALAGQIAAVVATSNTNAAAITAEVTARTTADTALAGQINTVSATANAKNRTFRQSTSPSGPVLGDLWFDTSANGRPKRWDGTAWVDSSDTRIAQNSAAITAEQVARADADTALASQISTVTASVNANAAAISTEVTARTAADTALAGQISTVNASVGALSASVTTQAAALADLEGNATASLVLRARAGGATGEIEVVAADNPAGPAVSTVVIRSDRFRFEGDLAEFLGTLKVETLHIREGAVTIPVFVFQPGTVRPVASPGVLVATGVINREGYATVITFGCQMGGPDYGEALFEIRRNGTAIHRFASGTGPRGASQSVYGQYVDTNTGLGATTYSVHAIWQADAQPFISGRSLNMIQTKR